ncbi:MAG TPA: conserved virulence factor C family protein [Bacillus sp. (in: firmicutes)]|uniref:conserved virulence factor C family protein n=1 Tax=Bacillus litorisediminis TaxID=2922713 RepID=UPI001FAD8B70|nr:conserved virulence factor C family protein [Bacillus litorisediminis]HWO76319.1 conserved virulence factor C family protein [Bacillus sp. (in: firmicutes)]
MNIRSIEPTPSPNTMKILLDQELPPGKSTNYKKDQAEDAPSFIKAILKIDGVKGVYHVADFLAVERNAKYDWKEILPQVRQAFGESTETTDQRQKADEHFGEVSAQVLTFKGIPVQIKINDGNEEKRFQMPDEYVEAMTKAQLEGENYVFLRKWKDLGVRYGDMDIIANEIIEELKAAYPSERLNELVQAAQNPNVQEKAIKKEKKKLTPEMLEHEDWRKRYQALEQIDNPTIDDIPVLQKALEDEKASIRRLAVVYLGMIEDKRVLPLLYQGLKDQSVAVRRTAGDCLSDLGFKEASEEMQKALKDPSKLVRWRAAMFLYEEGDESALPALKEAENDPEFEVALQIKMAIERIEGGEEAKGSVWKQMTEARKQ